MDALLVIDVDTSDEWEHDISCMEGARRDVAHLIRHTVDEWRAQGKLVVFIAYPWLEGSVSETAQIRGNGASCIVCDLPEHKCLAQFLGHRHGEQYEPSFIKTTNDAFTNGKLAGFLRGAGVTRLHLAGCNTFECVRATAQGAVREGFYVRLLNGRTYPPFYGDAEKKQWIAGVSAVKPKKSFTDRFRDAVSALGLGRGATVKAAASVEVA